MYIIDPKVGEFVYRPFCTSQNGKIISVGDHIDMWPGTAVTVKWSTGKITEENCGNLKDLEQLIADHERKINTHKKRIKVLEAL